MVYWEICCRATDTGFQCELPEGTYFIGDPKEMMLPGIYATIGDLNTGTFADAESDASIVLHNFSHSYFRFSELTRETHVYSESGVIALMSADIVKPLPEFEDNKITFSGRVVVIVNTQDDSIHMKMGTESYDLAAVEEPDETDEQMYTRLYGYIGINY
uniref:Uncharacterized protein n=1 Tax=viral metagenome TaxID=1070528 RepID=A0A6C0B3H9_9ZZZZ